MRYKAIIEYKGTRFAGFAKQIGESTIQDEIEEKLSKILQEEIHIFGSGRTDAGVHALNQVIHFDILKEIDEASLLHSINSIIDSDIRFKSLEKVSEEFHSRYNAKGKEYIYRISLGACSTFEKDYCLEILRPFDLSLFKECLSIFVGKHNFKNFTSKKEDQENFVREIYSIEVNQKENILEVKLNGNGFMRYMVRDIIGSSIEVATNKVSITKIVKSLDSNEERNILSYKADAKGLFLSKVIY